MPVAPEAALAVRNLGLILMAFSLVMILTIPFIGPVMVWMDLPLLLAGAAMAGWGHSVVRRSGLR